MFIDSGGYGLPPQRGGTCVSPDIQPALGLRTNCFMTPMNISPLAGRAMSTLVSL